jgi:hypothetical protein
VVPNRFAPAGCVKMNSSVFHVLVTKQLRLRPLMSVKQVDVDRPMQGGLHAVGAGAHAYPIEPNPNDPFQSHEVNYHCLLVEVGCDALKVTMHRLDMTSGTAVWTQPDSVTISVPSEKAVAHQ